MADKDDITTELGRTFDAAAMGYLSRAGANTDDWAMAKEVEHRSGEQQEALQDAYQREYPERVAAIQRRLEAEAAQRRVDSPAPRWAGAQPTKNFYEDAKRRVHLAHEADLARVRDATRREINLLVERALNRSQEPSLAQRAFKQASEGSTEVKRNGPKQSHD